MEAFPKGRCCSHPLTASDFCCSVAALSLLLPPSGMKGINIPTRLLKSGKIERLQTKILLTAVIFKVFRRLESGKWTIVFVK